MANQWALILVIIFGVSACAGFYTIISSYMGILAVEDEAHKAEVIAAGTEKLARTGGGTRTT